ncbi:MAG: TAXI family TRAP transporter solute-binding subunit [Magnetococcales bacterium]|nr:TAXI family TRAP transporter solute-binding subunit [Magnetococcales bacterium]
MRGRFARVCGVVLGVVFAACLVSRVVCAAEPDWPQSIAIATASPGGTYHVYGAALAKMLSRELGVSTAEQPTGGPVENLQLLESGAVQIGFVTMGAAFQAWSGGGGWTRGQTFRSIRALFPMYDTPFTFVVPKESGIQTLAGMSGKRIGVGPNGGTAGYYIPKMFAALNIGAELIFGSYAELSAQLLSGRIDVLAAAAGAPFPALAGLDAKKLVRFIPLNQSEIVTLRLALPELTPSTIPAGTYPSLMRDQPTVGLFNFAIARDDLPESLAYAIVEAVFRHRDELVRAHPTAGETIPANFSRNTFLPYHPGAGKYFARSAVKGSLQGD